MESSEVLDLFRKSGALLEGHFVLRSGLHSRQYFQCALLLQYPDLAERLCRALAASIDPSAIDAIISPAVGGLFVGHELARALGKRHIFAEKDAGALVLRRGFAIGKGERFLIGEDVVTLGGRVRETLDIVRNHGGAAAGIATLVHRGDSDPDFGCPFYRLLRLPVEAFPPDQLPPGLAAIPAVKPGSK